MINDNTALAMRGWIFGCVPALLIGCAVGPDFKRPESSSAAGYAQSPTSLPAAGPADVQQHVLPGQRVVGQWWELFHAQQLNDTLALAGILEERLRTLLELKEPI